MSRPPLLEVFFDCSSPWTYLGFHNIRGVAGRLGVEIAWRPIIVGGVFNEINPAVYEMRANMAPVKQVYTKKDMQDWARHVGVVLNYPPKAGHPVNAVKCMRACLVMQERGKMVEFATAAFRALWVDGEDLKEDAVLAPLIAGVDEDPAEVLAEIATPRIKQALWDNTNELIARGGFGSPTVFVDGDDMYFGNDRILLAEVALKAKLQQEARA
jgi:2-hydroxychromene-2-carboxylate isomerase